MLLPRRRMGRGQRHCPAPAWRPTPCAARASPWSCRHPPGPPAGQGVALSSRPSRWRPPVRGSAPHGRHRPPRPTGPRPARGPARSDPRRGRAVDPRQPGPRPRSRRCSDGAGKRNVPSSRRKSAGLIASSGGVRATDFPSAASTISPTTASRSAGGPEAPPHRLLRGGRPEVPVAPGRPFGAHLVHHLPGHLANPVERNGRRRR